tara:strand:- start:269 stop:703 length:435 start_codon:yes stop_codon:yes gene_type:complete
MDVEIPYLEIISDYMLSPHELKIKQNYEKILNIIYSNPKFNYKIYSTPEVINIATVLISYPELIIYIEEYVNKETYETKETNSMNMNININISIKKNTNVGKKRKSKQYVPLEKQDSKYIRKRRLNTESARRSRARKREQKMNL